MAWILKFFSSLSNQNLSTRLCSEVGSSLSPQPSSLDGHTETDGVLSVTACKATAVTPICMAVLSHQGNPLPGRK